VLVWPVAVQGEKAAAEVAAAVAGFNRLPEQGPVPRPDILIVARGGGSLEDLWAFNEEIVVRAAAASTIPLISAVGHETDTTLIDFVSDRRAPTPSAAAEMAVPVRADLMAQTLDIGKRTMACMNRLRLIEERQQRLDVSGERLALATRQLVERRGHALAAARLISPVAVLLAKQQALVGEVRVLEGAMRRYVGDTRQKIERTTDRIEQYGERLRRCGSELLAHGLRQVDQLGKLLESYSFHSVLNRGFALVRDQDGHPIMTAAETRAGDTIAIEFADGRIGAKVTEGAAAAPRAATPPRRRDGGSGNQGSLL
jgi:exodeoxyribonuclease VII large subunit